VTFGFCSDGLMVAPPPPKISRSSPPSSGTSGAASSSGDNSLSIEETNKLRARLGLKPLQPAASEVEKGSSTKTAAELMGGKDMGEFVHKPAESLSQRKKEEKIRSRLTERKEKRAIEAKLSAVRGIADEDSGDEDASAWVLRNRKIQEEKDKAEKRVRMVDL
jgi:U4/U6.U5 tri-snRNP-associated protein 1